MPSAIMTKDIRTFGRGTRLSSPASTAPPSVPDLTGAYGIYALNQIMGATHCALDADGEPITFDVDGIVNWPVSPAKIQTWYDQNGVVDLGQLDTARQPTISGAAEAIVFDGLATALQAATFDPGHTDKLTFYVAVNTDNVNPAIQQNVLETSAEASANDNSLALIQAGTNFTADQYGSPAASARSAKRKTMANTSYHIYSCVMDRTLAAANQTKFYDNGSATGVTSPISQDLSGTTFTAYPLNVGAADDGDEYFWDGGIRAILFFKAAHDDALRTLWQNYLNFWYGAY